jgi:hypothetical protein
LIQESIRELANDKLRTFLNYSLNGTIATTQTVLRKISIMMLDILAAASIWRMPEQQIHWYFI